ncbi:4-(cytidine 5'-diphospho)-2-C-methyl-D-erythritol kinase [Tropicimonas sediminicola]|uniref:4-diphosphocytidyl-2-C-methyl-D-erythritol kinase n=1 Tax=Tropicimonas sediminicola TaxID=1031541 RepID=A0A239C673_9RHOB|nr:4-(cytidine 5'-diphospho)-2-C-methyl-D-erythritol kinase [Tropicimonas sediminicola]SNS15610.1 4-diphosphocytidyl-2-C-methyl-D-erythritol kinase [Tropicimonas sediminicola]
MKTVEEAARAKVNLALHVTGRRADGYHTLDSLVVFADHGDRVTVRPAKALTFNVTGPRAEGVPTDSSNLVLRAAALFDDLAAEITLDKHLPAASGIGGGSADAAATLRALQRLTGQPLPTPEAILGLGADVPVCLEGRPVRMEGIGESLSPVPELPPLPAVLVNPGVGVATPAVFAALERRENPAMEAIPSGLRTPGDLAGWLRTQRNDLEPPAMALQPRIATVLSALRQLDGCLIARMSGSGATCFAIFPDAAAARAAATQLRARHPNWWTADCTLA